MTYIIKKDGTKELFNPEKIKKAIKLSADRIMINITSDIEDTVINTVHNVINNKDEVDVKDIHKAVELGLDKAHPAIAKSYRDYRNYKIDFVSMLNEVYQKEQSIKYIGDRSNANTDSALVSTKRSLVYGELNKELYKKFNLTPEELQACKDGYIYVHDMSARRDCINCCLSDIGNILKDGFEMGNIWYNEPKTLDTAFDVISDVILSAASNQYGGFTVPEIDKILVPYAWKSYEKYFNKYSTIVERYKHLDFKDIEQCRQDAICDVRRDFEQGWQGLEYKLNTVASSRGDYPFTTFTFGLSTDEFGKMASETCMKVRMKGQGKEGHKKPVLFPKLVFLYDENIHGEGKESEDLFNIGIECSSKTMYPDWLSMSGEGYVPSIYKKYNKVISPMGCRAFLSPWYERGGMKPADENDVPVFVGRFNCGVISLNFPMILAKAQQEHRDFYEVLDYYLEMIRIIHKRTYDFLGEMRASTNPLQFCQGGFYGGNLNPNDKIRPLLKSSTFSFGITALNELNRLYNGKSIREDGQFPLEMMEYINNKLAKYKEEDGILYAIYGTPAESLCHTQVKQFRKKYGIIENISDKEYMSNSFHCHVSEDITPIEKQDNEYRFWDLFNGGKIQYVKYPIAHNIDAIKILVKRAMKMGLYEGVNLSLAYCENCGHEELNMDICPVCGSKDLTKIERTCGYLGYSRVKGNTRFNDGKMAEIKDRVSM